MSCRYVDPDTGATHEEIIDSLQGLLEAAGDEMRKAAKEITRLREGKHFQPDERMHTYLGDGVYAHYSSPMIWLSCDRENGEHAVALEPQVLSALMKYAVKIGWLKKEGEWDALGQSAIAAYFLCESLLAIREGATDELIREIRDALKQSILDAGLELRP